jgi:hypothetical protein
MAAYLTSSDCVGSNVVDGTNDDMLWNDSEEDGDVSGECEEDEESMAVKMETATLIRKGR